MTVAMRAAWLSGAAVTPTRPCDACAATGRLHLDYAAHGAAEHRTREVDCDVCGGAGEVPIECDECGVPGALLCADCQADAAGVP